MMGPYRNHPVYLLKYSIFSLFLAVIVSISTEIYYLLLLVLIPLFFLFRVWYKTRYTFDDDGVRVEKSTAFRSDTVIPYSKVSSINIVRSVLDRVFGSSTLSFNINSSVNSESPEMSLILRKEMAEELKQFIESKIYGFETPDTETEQVFDYVTFTDMEVITHNFTAHRRPRRESAGRRTQARQ